MATPAVTNIGANLMHNRRCKWSEDEIVKLLEAWSQKDVQALLGHGPPKTQEAFEKVVFYLASLQIFKTSLQCREKMKSMQLVYKSLTTGQGKIPRTMNDRIVQKLLSVMGRLPPAPTTQPNVRIIGSNNSGTAAFPNSLSSHFQASTVIGPPAGAILTNRSSAFEDLSNSEDDVEMAEPRPAHAPIMTSTPSRRASRETRVRVGVGKKSLRRKKSAPSQKNTAVYVLIDKLIATQAASNERFAALEEKRILMEKELEKMRLAAEARSKEAQRQHELQLSSAMAQHISCALKILDPGAILRIGDPSKSHYVEVVNGCGPCGELATDTNAVYSTIY